MQKSVLTKTQNDWTVVGFPKCGTSALTRYLADLPKIHAASHLENLRGLELHYYDDDSKSVDYLAERYQEGCYNGHKTANYIYSKKVLSKIYQDNPDVKIIIAIRELNQVLVSWWKMHKNIAKSAKIGSHFTCRDEITRNQFLVMSLDEYFERMKNQLDHDRYLKEIMKIFPHQQIFIVRMESLASKPYEALLHLYRFITLQELQGYDVSSFSTKGIKKYDDILDANLSLESSLKLKKMQEDINETLNTFNGILF